MKLKIPMKLKTKLLHTKLTLGKHSPEILLAAGIVGVVTSTVMACAATTKAATAVQEANDELAEIKGRADEHILIDGDAEKEKRKAAGKVCWKLFLRLFELYGPAILLGSASIGSIVGSNYIHRKRHAKLAAAYSGLSLAYAKSRDRIRELLGEGADEELLLGIGKKEVEVTETDPETGEVTTRKDILDVVEDDVISPYAFWFERPNVYAEDSLRGNLMLLEAFEKKANMIFTARAYSDKPMPLFLNEVLEMVGIPITPIGQFAGWMLDPDNKSVDNAIKFRPRVLKKPDGFGGYRDAILLDFNVDGDVLSKWYDACKKSR